MEHTHDLTFAGPVLTKRYTSWDRGEHRREWTVLQLVHDHAPDLAPVPLRADLDADPPTVTMSRLPGVPLGATPAPAQLEALATAITQPASPLPAHAHSRPKRGQRRVDHGVSGSIMELWRKIAAFVGP
jgi:hypothetical protein